MFRSIWHIIRRGYSLHRCGIDTANIEHLRADLRFRLSMMEYAYYGRSGRRVARCLSELKTLLGEKAVHRYLRSMDPDLRTQFVERFQGAKRELESGADPLPKTRSKRPPKQHAGQAVPPIFQAVFGSDIATNVVPIDYAARKAGGAGSAPAGTDNTPRRGARFADTKD